MTAIYRCGISVTEEISLKRGQYSRCERPRQASEETSHPGADIYATALRALFEPVENVIERA